MTDLHIHTSFSFDSEEVAENYVRAALSRGDGALGFTEHYDLDAIYGGATDVTLPDLSAYSAEIDRLRSAYPQIKILKGIELGYSPKTVARYKALLKENDFDYAIVSVHTLDGRGDCYYPAFFEGLSKAQSYGGYLEAVLESVRFCPEFSIVGHLGYVSRYAPYPDKRLSYRDFPLLVDEILKGVIERGLCLEINTSCGFKDGFLPTEDILKRYIALGGKNFTFGSDAHSVDRYADGAERVRSFLLSCGITEICRYENRRLIREKLI